MVSSVLQTLLTTYLEAGICASLPFLLHRARAARPHHRGLYTPIRTLIVICNHFPLETNFHKIDFKRFALCLVFTCQLCFYRNLFHGLDTIAVKQPLALQLFEPFPVVFLQLSNRNIARSCCLNGDFITTVLVC